MIMKSLKTLLFGLIIGMLFPSMSSAQIGYQVSLLNSATGEPRANVSVEAEVTITNSEAEEIYKGTQRATSNDFGVIQLTVGNQSTFKDVDWSKLPFFIEVSVDGTVIGKSQILAVPVAEVAKKVVPVLTPKDLEGTWVYTHEWGDRYTISFRSDYTGTLNAKDGAENFSYEIDGYNIITYHSYGMNNYRFHNGKLYNEGSQIYYR